MITASRKEICAIDTSSSSSSSSSSSNSKLKLMTNVQLTQSLKSVSIREREVIADVVAHIHEFMRRRLYLEHGCTSVFGYLVGKLGYSNATAQNRIEAARLLFDVPELQDDLASGAINLTQVSVLAQGLRQGRRGPSLTPALNAEQKSNLLSQLRHQTVERSAVIVSQNLDLQLKAHEKTRHQKDESVVLEVTLTKKQFEDLRRAKNLSSHVQHDSNWAEVISHLAAEYLKRKDLSKPKRDGAHIVSAKALKPKITSDPNHAVRRAIPMATKRIVAAQGGWKCSHVDRKTGEICESQFQLQFDHILSVAKGGGNEPENLQVLCATHNRLKFERHG